jgi:1-acyl-sn-glycerol-3-phosphate acyltransferase
MPRWLRIFLTGLSFAMFFGGSLLFGLVASPLLFLVAAGRRSAHRQLVTRVLQHGYGVFLFWMKLVRLIDYEKPRAPPQLRGGPYLLVANHPTLIDVLFLLNSFDGLTCLVKAHWYRSFLVRSLLRSTLYVPGPGMPGDDDHPGSPTLDRMVEQLQAGHALMVFPEGSRSLATQLRRFRRGAFEAARRAGVPILPVFIGVDRPMLMKGVPFWKVPSGRARFDFEVGEPIDPNSYPDAVTLRDQLAGWFRTRFERSLQQRAEGPRLTAPVCREQPLQHGPYEQREQYEAGT